MGKMRRWRRHSLEFKREAVERMRSCESIDALARELDIQRKLLYTWRYQFEGHPERRHANYGITAEERKEWGAPHLSVFIRVHLWPIALVRPNS